MSQKFKSDIELQAGLRDSSGALGTSGQILSSTGSNVSWINQSTAANDVQNQVKAGVAINKGQAVYVTGADGTNIIVGLASNASEATSSKTLGLLNATVAINGMADVVQIGRLSGLNTLGATAGDPVWLGTGGNLIYGLIGKPYAPANLVFIGIVTRVNVSNGEIFVNVQNGFELNEIHDVDLKTTVPINGDVLGFNGTLWVNKTIAGWLGYTPANASGTTNYVSKFTGTTTLGNSLLFDNGTNVGIGTTSPGFKLDVNGDINLNYGSFYKVGSTNLVNDSQYIPKATTLGYFINSLIYDDGTNIGIGTTSPTQQLQTTGDAIIRNAYIGNIASFGTNYASFSHTSRNGGGDYSLLSDNVGITYLNASASQSLRFRINNLDKAILDSNGNVGIGTTSPAGQFQVYTNAYKQFHINYPSIYETRLNFGTAAYAAYDAGSATLSLFATDASYGSIALGAGGSEKMRIIANGNVGIGTTSAFSKVEIAGAATSWANSPAITFTDNAGTVNSRRWLIGNVATDYGSLNFAVSSTNSNDPTNPKMTITKEGNVGIGTSSPSTKLDVYNSSFIGPLISTTSNYNAGIVFNNNNGAVDNRNWAIYTDGYTYGDLHFIQSNAVGGSPVAAGTSRMVISLGGNVGIGTTSPSEKLSIKSADVAIKLEGTTNSYLFQIVDSNNRLRIFDNTNNVERITLTSGGNVGIGTTSPGSLLQVGQISSNTDSLIRLSVGYSTDRSSRGGITWNDSTNVTGKIYTEYDGTRVSMVFGSLYNSGYNSNQLMVIRGNGNVGIGTSSPEVSLDVVGINGGTAQSRVRSTSGGDIRMSVDTVGRLGTYSNSDLLVLTNSSERMRIDSSGNILVGQTSPIYSATNRANLTIGKSAGSILVLGTSTASNGYLFYNNTDLEIANSTASGSVFFRTSGTERMRITSSGIVQVSSGDIFGGNLASDYGSLILRGGYGATTGSASKVEIRGYEGGGGTQGAIISYTNGTERMRIMQGGNVGIGTTTPGYKLQVNDTIATVTGFGSFTALQSAAGTGFRWTLNNDGTFRVQKTADGFFNISATPIMIDSSNRVGIGTTAPQRDLQVGAFSGSPEICIGSSTTGNGTLAFGDGATGNDPWRGYVQYNHSVDAMIFGTVNGEKVRITSAGYMGIGTTTPSYPLHVGTQVSNVSIYADYDIVAFSDQSVKENIRPIENALERVIESRGVLYDRIDSGEKDNIGFIAQELEVAFPELIVTNEDGTKAVKYQNAVAVLFEAVKEQQKQIDEIKRILNGITN